MDDEPFAFTDANGNGWRLETWPLEKLGERKVPQQYYRCATLADLTAALSAQGYALVRVVGTEPTFFELRRLAKDTDWETDSLEAVYRALYLAGSASREPEIERLRARVKELESLPATSLLGHVEREKWDTLLQEQWRERTKAEERATTAEAELARVRAELERSDRRWYGKLQAADTERDEARAKLAECERDAVRSTERARPAARVGNSSRRFPASRFPIGRPLRQRTDRQGGGGRGEMLEVRRLRQVTS